MHVILRVILVEKAYIFYNYVVGRQPAPGRCRYHRAAG